MTVVTTEDDPEISFGGEDHRPLPSSAPSVTASIIDHT